MTMPTRAPAQTPAFSRVVFAFALVYVFWGSTYLGMRIAVEQIPPALMCGVRFLIAGPLMLLWCRLSGRKLTLSTGQLWRLAVVGLLLLSGGNTTVAWAEQHVPSGIAALIVAAVPLWVMLIEWLVMRGERLAARGLSGLALGIAGMAVLLWPRLTGADSLGRSELVGAAGLIGASASWALGSVLARRWQTASPKDKDMDVAPAPRLVVDAFVATGWEMTFAGVANLVVSLLSGEYHRAAWTVRGFSAVMYLVVFGSWVGFSAYIWLLQHVPTAKVATYAYVNPVVAVLLGWLVLHERVDAYVLCGTAIIVAGVALVTSAKVHAAETKRALGELPACETGAD